MFPGLDNAVLLAPHFCPLRCGEQILGKHLDQHMQEECPKRQALCPEGCGERIAGHALEEHRRASCPMNILLTRAESAIRENSMREYRLAVDGVYQEREHARARVHARGEEGFGWKGWPSQRCRFRVEKIEAESRQLVQRSRQRAREHLTAAIAAAGAEAASEPGKKEGPVNALKYWDAFNNVKTTERGARPWDMENPDFQQLLDALDAAAIAGADVNLRRRGEGMLVSCMRNILNNARNVLDDRHVAIAEALERVSGAMPFLELNGPPAEILDLVQETEQEARKASLKVLSASAPEFYQALAKGDVELCSWLLERERASPSIPDPRSGLPPLLVAVRAGDLPMSTLLLEWHADIHQRCGMDGTSALHWAAHHRTFRVMSLLLAKKANPRLQDKRGQDALMKLLRRDMKGPAPGCAWTWETAPRRRLKGKILEDISGVMDLGTARAAGEAEPECVGLCFLEEEARERDGPFGSSGEEERSWPIYMCKAPVGSSATSRPQEAKEEDEEFAWTSHLKMPTDAVHDVRALIAAGADVGAVDSSGLTALHHHLRSAPGRGDLAVVMTLVRGSADVNARDSTERSTTPLLLTVSSKRADLVGLMINEAFPPADVDARSADGTSALELAESINAHEVARLLREAGASAWHDAEVRLGARTTFSFDSRAPPLAS